MATRLLLLAGLLAAATGPARAETLYIEAGLVLPIDGEPIPGGRIVVRDGRIAELGAELERPPFSHYLDARGLTVTPGFVVPQSSLSLPGPSGRPTRPGQAVRVSTSARAKAADELYPLHPELRRLARLGITTLGLLPVSADSGVRGQVSAVSTTTPEGRAKALEAEAAVLVDVDVHGPWRTKLQAAFDKAAEAAENEAKAKKEKKGGRRGGKGGKSKDPLVRVLGKQQPLFLFIDGGAAWTAASDVLPLEDADVVVLGYGRTWELAEQLKEAGVRVITSPVLTNRPRTRIPVNRAAEFERAGVPFAFRLPTDNLAGASVLRDQAIEMVRTGAGADAVLAALTLEGAKALGLGKQVGAIAKGRRADLLFWSAHPLDPLATLERVLVAGEELAPLPRAGRMDPAAGTGDGA